MHRINAIYQHVEIFPEVLSHETEESQESPSKAVKAGVAVVGVSASFHAGEAFWTSSGRNTHQLKIKAKKIY